MNTKIELMYRDADNYKRHEYVILSGEITSAHLKAINSKLEELENDFNVIAEQLGLPTPSFTGLCSNWPDKNADHVFTTLADFEDANEDGKDSPDIDDMLVDAPPTLNMTVDEFVHRLECVVDWDVKTEWKRMKAAGKQWDPFDLTPKNSTYGPAVDPCDPNF